MRPLVRSCLVLGLALLALPAGSAEPARVGLGVAVPPYVTAGQETVLVGNVTYSYETSSANATSITLTATSSSSWLRVRVDPALVMVDASGPSGRTVAPIRILLDVASNAPALEPQTVQVRLEAAANPPLEPVTSTVGLTVRAAFLGRLQVTTAERLEARPGEPAALAVRVVNEGNGPARVTFEAVDVPAGVIVLPPGAVLAEARGALRERSLNISILASQPGEVPIVLRYASTHAFDATLTGAGGEVRAVVAVGSAGLPGAATALALAGVGLAALLRRR